MPLPFRPPPSGAADGRAAFLDLLADDRSLTAGLLVIDGLGRPHELVHNRVELPAGAVWSGAAQRAVQAELVASLFVACRLEPDLLVLAPSLAADRVAGVALPCCRPVDGAAGEPDWEWLNQPPTADMRAALVAAELLRRGCSAEPFERLRAGLHEVYGEPGDD